MKLKNDEVLINNGEFCHTVLSKEQVFAIRLIIDDYFKTNKEVDE